jgi:hypothetical protein
VREVLTVCEVLAVREVRGSRRRLPAHGLNRPPGAPGRHRTAASLPLPHRRIPSAPAGGICYGAPDRPRRPDPAAGLPLISRSLPAGRRAW